MALTKAAQDYLMAVDREKKKQMERGGQAAADAFVKTQTDKAKYLSGDDNKMQAVAQRRIDASKAKKADEAIKKASQISKGVQGPPAPKKDKPPANRPSQKKQQGNNNPRGRGFFGDLMAPFK